MQVISRLEARSRGLNRYFTGKPCCSGHLAERIVSNRECVSCRRAKDLKRVVAQQRRWRAANPTKARELRRRWESKNPQHARHRRAKYRATKLRATPSWVDHEELKRIY